MATTFRQPDKEPDSHRCPNCAEVIQREAILCRFCHSGLSPQHFYPCPSCAEMVRNEASQCKSCQSSLTPREIAPSTLSVIRGKPQKAPFGGYYLNQDLMRAVAERLKAVLQAEIIDIGGFGDEAQTDVLFWHKLDEEHHSHARARLRQLITMDQVAMSSAEKSVLLQGMLDDTFGWGPLGSLLRIPNTDVIMVLTADVIVVKSNGQSYAANEMFDSKEHMLQCIERIAFTAQKANDSGFALQMSVYTAQHGWLMKLPWPENALEREPESIEGMPLMIVCAPRCKGNS